MLRTLELMQFIKLVQTSAEKQARFLLLNHRLGKTIMRQELQRTLLVVKLLESLQLNLSHVLATFVLDTNYRM